MTGRANVRTHTRRGPNGQRVTVTRHTRRTRGLVSPGHAWQLFRRSLRAGKRKRRAVAFTLGALAVGELGCWLTLRGVFLLLGTAALLALGAAILAGIASGAEHTGMNRPAPKRKGASRATRRTP